MGHNSIRRCFEASKTTKPTHESTIKLKMKVAYIILALLTVAILADAGNKKSKAQKGNGRAAKLGKRAAKKTRADASDDEAAAARGYGAAAKKGNKRADDQEEAAEPANAGKARADELRAAKSTYLAGKGKGKADDQQADAVTNLLKAAKIKSKAEASDSQAATYAGYYGGANQIKAGKGKADDQ